MRDMEIFRIFVFFLVVTINHARVIISAPRQARLSLADPMPYYYHNDIDGHPGTYSYGYDVADPATGNSQFRTEERYPNGTVVGSYGYVDARGRPHRYTYIADERGYRVRQDPFYKPYQEPAITPAPYPIYHTPNQSLRPTRPSGQYPAESSVTWTRPRKPNRRKNYNYYANRPTNNFIGPPSSYAED